MEDFSERFFATQSLNTSIAFTVPLFSFNVPSGGSLGFNLPETDAFIEQIFILFGFILLASFGLLPILVGVGQPTVGRLLNTGQTEAMMSLLYQVSDLYIQAMGWT